MLKLLKYSKITTQLIEQTDPKNEGRAGQWADN